MKEGDFVRVDYTLKIKESGELFDTTKEDVAKSANKHNSKIKYKPLTVILGAGFVFKSLEEDIKGMKVGESKTVDIAADKAFGPRRADLVKLFPMSDFKQSNIDVKIGETVTVSGITGKIANISGGRVRVDFNHPLAGKDLVYDLDIKELIDTAENKVRAIVSYLTNYDEQSVKTSINDKSLSISIDKEKDIRQEIRVKISDLIRKWIEKFDKIDFVYTH